MSSLNKDYCNVCNLSIIIVSFNTKDLISKCLSSLNKHITGIHYEVIVVDNNSADGSVELLEKEFSHLRLIKNNNNLGFAKANNQGISASKGKFVLLLNSDTELYDESIKKVIPFLEGNQNIGILGPNLINMDGSVQLFSCGYFPTLLRVFTQFFGISRMFKTFKCFKGINKYALNKSEYVDWVSGAAMFIRRDLIDKIGMLDERFFMYLEDLEFCLRAKKAGADVFFKDDVYIKHVGMGSSRGRENMLAMKRKWISNMLTFCNMTIQSKIARKLAKFFIVCGIFVRLIGNSIFAGFRKSRLEELKYNVSMLEVLFQK